MKHKTLVLKNIRLAVSLTLPGWPKASANIRSKIAAQAPDLADIHVSLPDGLLQLRAESDDIRDPVPDRHKPGVPIICHFIPPHISVKVCRNLHWHGRSLDLHVR